MIRTAALAAAALLASCGSTPEPRTDAVVLDERRAVDSAGPLRLCVDRGALGAEPVQVLSVETARSEWTDADTGRTRTTDGAYYTVRGRSGSGVYFYPADGMARRGETVWRYREASGAEGVAPACK